MLSFFTLAAQSPTRQQAFRRAVIAHLAILAGGVWALRRYGPDDGALLLGYLLLIAGIVEGAALLGWRLTQLPKSQALEFLLVTPLRPRCVFLAETLVGLARLTLVTFSGLPVLVLLMADGYVDVLDLIPLLLMPLTWGVLTGLGLTIWAYEPVAVRRWGERVALGLIVLQLAVGVLAGEHLRHWLEWLPEGLGRWLLVGFHAFHRYNPFAVIHHWLEEGPAVAADRMWRVELAALTATGLLLARGAGRLQGHFQDRHYRVKRKEKGKGDGESLSFTFFLFPFSFRERSLAWWAVRRVTEYSGRINLWLAGGFGALYALYILAGPSWPAWLGRQVFVLCDQLGGIPGLATALMVLAAVPASFQYGLWDSSAQDRCRRLELLLLTHLQGEDYWDAAAAAAWRRGRGYFGIAVLLWGAAALAGRVPAAQAVTALAAGVVLWGLYFALGFRAFSRGMQANTLGMLLTLGLPLLAYGLYRAGWPLLAALVPAGNVYAAGVGLPAATWLPGLVLAAAVALVIARLALTTCDRELRRWYELHHGRKVMT
jgi:hypothetical protein